MTEQEGTTSAYSALLPPADGDAEGWKELALRRGEEYNRCADQLTDAWVRVQELEGERDRLREIAEAKHARIGGLKDELSEAESRLARLEEALERIENELGEATADYRRAHDSTERGEAFYRIEKAYDELFVLTHSTTPLGGA